MNFLSLLAVALSLVSATVAAPSCNDKKTLSQAYIGESKDVSIEYLHCSNIIHPVPEAIELKKRQTPPVDVCGAACTTNCFVPTGGGPDPNECKVIADALLYDSEAIGALFTLDPATTTSLIAMKYNSCETFITSQVTYPLQYCRNDWSTLVNYIAVNCQSTENAHGGNCVAADQRWFIQVQHS
ncbi:hypothetical protein BV25DRAFT_1841173 [Artomyces pyxidatus]|uniref:Uncharacterized protein n=1 Tax=Artomyces pyxidatus TaxID=48021 RepID=A0ACB8SQY6_9AGAM|nr:hypothetical protein BV25DRAFT_1841173 [Artomyces pyxidatus]